MTNGIAILSLLAIAGLNGLIDSGDGQTPPSQQDLLHTPPIEIYLNGEWVAIDPSIKSIPTHPARSGRESGIGIGIGSDLPADFYHPVQPIASEIITRGYGIHQINIIRDKFLGGWWTTEIVRPTKPPIIEKPRTVVIEREFRGGGVERVFVPTTNVEVREFLEGME